MEKSYSPSIIPVYLEASSKQELVRKMIATNRMNNKMYNYFSPIKDGRKWVVWYYADVLRDRNLESFWTDLGGLKDVYS